MKRIVIYLLLLLIALPMSGQTNLLENPVLLGHVKKGLDAIYSFDFEEGERQIQEVSKYTTDHPALYFLKGFEIYWKYFPLTPDSEKAPEFIEMMEECIRISRDRLDKNENDLEAIFFDLFGRSFYVMFWADNGKPAKVFPHLNILYRHTVEGFDLMHIFNEFYFTTGLYNYYIEAYPEKHPAYKPIVALFQDGDKVKGLEELKYCANHAVFLRVEAKLFLSLLYMNYENNPDSASVYAAELYNEFPENPYYAGNYLEILIYNKKYFFAPIILDRLKNDDNEFSRMQYNLFMAMYLEKYEKKYTESKKLYDIAVELSLRYGYFADHYTAMAYMGLGRYYARKGNDSKANKYFRDAGKNTAYDYVLLDR